VNYDIGLFDTKDNSETSLVQHPASDRLLGWLPNSDEILFLSDRAGSQDIWAMKIVDGKAMGSPRPVTRDIGQIAPQGLTRDGSLYFSRYTRRFTTCVVSFDMETGAIPAESKMLLLGSNFYPEWSPDGESMAYVTETEDKRRLHIRNLTTGEERELAGDIGIRSPSWSPDGRSILAPGFDNRRRAQGDCRGGLYTIDVEKDQATLLVQFPAHQRGWAGSTGEWSLDGKAVFYLTPSGIVRRDLDSGQEKQLYRCDSLSRALSLSPDGKRLAFCTGLSGEGQGQVMTVPVVGGQPTELCSFEETTEGFRVPKKLAWTPDGNYILFAKNEKKGSSIWRVASQGGVPQMILESDDRVHSLCVHPNGEQMAYSTYIQEGAIWVMENLSPGGSSPVAKPEPEATTLRKLSYPWGGYANLSPDGRYLCDVDWDVDWETETEKLVLRELATGKVRALTTAGRPEYAAISPASDQVAYLCLDANWAHPGLYTVGLDGSDRRCVRQDDCLIPKDWSPDGSKILALEPDEDPKQLVWVSVVDGSRESIVSVDRYYLQGEGHPGKFDVSPDGRFIAYDRRQAEDSEKHDLFIFDLVKTRANAIASHPAHEKLLGWTPDGRSILFASDRTGTWDAWLQRVTNGVPQGFPELIKKNMGDIIPIGLTQGGAFYYHTGNKPMWDVFIAALDLDKGRVLAEPMPVCQTGTSHFTDWSPDGRQLAYCAGRPGELKTIHIRDLATGEEREIDTGLPVFAYPHWSPDGRSILGATARERPHSIYRIDAQTGDRTELVRSTTGALWECELFPDGETLLYVRNDPNSRSRCCVVRNLATGHEEDLVRATRPVRLEDLALSPDGQRLVYVTSTRVPVRSQALKIIPAVGGKPRELLQFDESEKMWLGSVAWTPDSQDVLFVKRLTDDEGGELWRIPARGGEPRKVWAWNKPFSSLSVHPDGQRVAFHTSTTASEMWVMENFLPKAVAAARE
jgi:Tol biopolymer transport system component